MDQAAHALSEALPADLFGTPLECIFADNFRCRVLCTLLEQISCGGVVELRKVDLLLQFLRVDFQKHMADEEQTFFPLLRERALSSDGIDRILTALAIPQGLLEQVVDGLAELQGPQPAYAAQSRLRELLDRFVSIERRRVSIENIELLPLARRILSPDDLTTLGRSMYARRQSGSSLSH